MQITIHHYNHTKTVVNNAIDISVDGIFPNPTIATFRQPVLIIHTPTGVRRIVWNQIKNFHITDDCSKTTKETDF